MTLAPNPQQPLSGSKIVLRYDDLLKMIQKNLVHLSTEKSQQDARHAIRKYQDQQSDES